MAHPLVSGLFREHVPPLPRGRFIEGGGTETRLFCSPIKEGDGGTRAGHEPAFPRRSRLVFLSELCASLKFSLLDCRFLFSL